MFNCAILITVLKFGLLVALQKSISVDVKDCLSLNADAEFEPKTSFLITEKSVNHPNKFQIVLSTLNKDELITLGNQNLYYRLSLTTNQSNKTFRTSAKACMLVNSNLMATLVISMDHASNIIGFNLYPNNPEQCTNVDRIPVSDKINVNLIIQSPEPAILPDTLSFIQKMESEKESNKKGETKDNRSFLAKYWMYIVPVFIFVLLSSLQNPEDSERNGSGGGN